MLKAVQPVMPVLLGIILIEAALGIIGAVMGIQMASREVPSFLIGIVFAYFAGFLAGSLTCERLINRVGYIRAFGVFAVSASIATLLLAVTDNIYAWTLFKVMTGYAIAGAFVVIESWLNDKASEDNRGRIFAVYMVASWAPAACRPVAQHRQYLQRHPVRDLDHPDGGGDDPLGVDQGRQSGDRTSPILQHREVDHPADWRHLLLCLGPADRRFLFAAPGLCRADRPHAAGAVRADRGRHHRGADRAVPDRLHLDHRCRRPVIIGTMAVATAMAPFIGATPTLPFAWLLGLFFVLTAFQSPLYALGVGQTNDYVDRKDFVPAAAGLLFLWASAPASARP